mgnify:CR=1 FL=1
MKTRAKKEGYPVEREFTEFRSFLRHMGPRPPGDFSIDREDRETYGPMTCIWKDRSGQANNRRTTIFLTCDGVRQPLALWARQTGQKQGTLRARLDRGWPHRAVIYGKEKPAAEGFGRNPYRWLPWPTFWPGDRQKQEAWEHAYQRRQDREDGLYRIRFLIREVARTYSDDADFLSLHEGDVRPEVQKEIALRRDRLSRATEILDRAYPLLREWEAAAEAWTRTRQNRDTDGDEWEDDIDAALE